MFYIYIYIELDLKQAKIIIFKELEEENITQMKNSVFSVNQMKI